MYRFSSLEFLHHATGIGRATGVQNTTGALGTSQSWYRSSLWLWRRILTADC